MTIKISALIVLCSAAFALSACGKAGAPLSPYQAGVERAKTDGTPAPEKPVTDKPFVLDRLLD